MFYVSYHWISSKKNWTCDPSITPSHANIILMGLINFIFFFFQIIKLVLVYITFKSHTLVCKVIWMKNRTVIKVCVIVLSPS